jgi:hypothetical protein
MTGSADLMARVRAFLGAWGHRTDQRDDKFAIVMMPVLCAE